MDWLAPHLPGLLLGFGVFALGILSPGPNIVAIIGTSMASGRPAGTALALGISFGSGIWGLSTWAGVASVLTLYASVMAVIKIAGAAYLLWLAIKAFRSAWSPPPRRPAPGGDVGAGTRFRQGLAIQMSNPKAALTWIAGMSLAVDAESPLWVGAVLIGGTLAITTAGHLLYALAFSSAPMVAAYGRARRWIEVGLGAFFCVASYKLLTLRS